ncbi:MAG: D-alanine--D-alanine ligase [Flavobacteriales bacterium]|nr:D-alanine--D-alanine ligase [Flavobacteriales bacterium]
MRVGIIFGGASREREVSFAGGRTVYDNLNKSLFEPVPVFVDSFGRFILLEWPYIYKGSIRDFYPPSDMVPESAHGFQVYAESITEHSHGALTDKLGKHIAPEQLADHMDIAFLCLHGTYGEDGRIQGMLEYLGIPYTGSGILPSSIAIDKVAQRKWMDTAGFPSPRYMQVSRESWRGQKTDLFREAEEKVGFPLVVKSARQGSSIGVSILMENDPVAFQKALDKSFFYLQLEKKEWEDIQDKVHYIKRLCDFRENLGLPLFCNRQIIHHPDALLKTLTSWFDENNTPATLESVDGEEDVLIEAFIEGREFSCIVIQDENGAPMALPPTEIRKRGNLFDYRSKYLPGLSRKITPIDLPTNQINAIRQACEQLFDALFFDVYARIDGFITQEGTVFLNDPNTTSGMMPSSFFFHQAAEIGLNPSQFLSYIIQTSLVQRKRTFRQTGVLDGLLNRMDELLAAERAAEDGKTKIAVILGGYSSERHISVESGRNVYEKLASSSTYLPVPIFLTGDENAHALYEIPINILLKDNADDICEKATHFHIHEVIRDIIQRASGVTRKFSHHAFDFEPKQINYETLKSKVDAVFIALHGRPGEDGAVQAELEKLGLPYNGSGPESSSVTIDKYKTNQILREHGFLVANHRLVEKEEWAADPAAMMMDIEKGFNYPLIAKPVDDGCSSAVIKIKNREQLEAYARTFFRSEDEISPSDAKMLGVTNHAEFTHKKTFLVESLISKEGADHFLEITGGLLTHLDRDGHIRYEVFEASEALTEGDVLSLEEKFLAGEGQNITPARYNSDPKKRQAISDQVREIFEKAASLLNIQGYARIDAFVRTWKDGKVEVIFVEVNSLPGMTPATCIFHQTAINGYKPFEFIDKIMEFGALRTQMNNPVKA